MSEERVYSARSAVIRAEHQSAIEARDATDFYWKLSSNTLAYQVPARTRKELLTSYRELLRATGRVLEDDPTLDNEPSPEPKVTEPETEAPKAEPSKPEDEEWQQLVGSFGDVESVGLGETLETPAQRTRELSVYHTVLQQYFDRWSAKWEFPNKLPISWHPVKINGEKVWIVATFKIRGENFLWNLTGKPNWDDHSVLPKCKENILVHHDNRSVCLSRDLENTFNVPAGWVKSLVKGTTQKIQFAVFLWMVKDQPGKELRFWINEEKLSGEKIGDIHTFRLAMPAT